MKTIKILRKIVVIGLVFSTGSAFAYNSGNTERECKPPKFRTFSPPKKTKDTPVPEVAPEAEVGFTVSGNADPTTIRAVAKEHKLKLTVVDRKSYYDVTANLPAELNGKYVRIHLYVKSQKGECKNKGGWLMKVKKVDEGSEPVTVEE